MEVKKAIKRIVAFSAGATMVGATVLSAMAAADLGSYPAPFVKSGVFDAIIVVGDKAAAEDVVGAVDIGASLQYAMKTAKTVQGCAGGTPTITNGIAIAKTGSYLNYNETLATVRDTPLGPDELPTILTNGRYTESKGNNNNDVTYTQKLILGSGPLSGQFLLLGYGVSPYPTDKDANNYIYFANNNQNLMYNYRLDFDSNVLYDNTTTATAIADVKDTQIELQGGKYTITSVKASGAGNSISEVTMMAGDTLLWLTQDQKITKTVSGVSHEIQVVDVTELADSCGVSVDGDVVWIDKGASETINGVKIGVTDAKAVHAQLQDQDICQINIGSSELKLRGASTKMQVDGADLSNAYGAVVSTGASGVMAMTGLNITFYPNDRVYMAQGESYNDPVFQRFKFSFGGLANNDYETMKMEVTADDRAQFTFLNYEGKSVLVPFYMNTTTSAGTPTIKTGSSPTEPLLLPGNSYTVINQGDQQGMQFYYVTSGQVAHILRLDSIDINNKKLSLKDVTYDKAYSDKTFVNGSTNSVDLGGTGTISLNISGDMKTVYFQQSAVNAKTKNEAQIVVARTSANGTNGAIVNVTERDDGDSAGFGSGVLNLIMSNTSASSSGYQKITLTPISTTSMTGLDALAPPVSVKYGNNDVKLTGSAHGTAITFDNKDNKWITVMHSKKDIVGNVFVAPVSAEVTAMSGSVETVTVSKINLGAARLASEVKDVTADNMIVVGGPCANDVAAQIMGQSGATCASGFTEGKASIKLYEQSTGKVAMLVAGMTALDTRRATRVVAGYDQYAANLKGTEVAVTGTSLTDITVSAPQ